MNQTQSKENNINLPPRMKSALNQYKKRVWIIKLAEGTLAALFGLIISYLVVFGLDRLFDTHPLLRALILVIGMVGMVVFLPLKYYNWVWKNRRLEGIARLLQRKFPRFGDHVLGIIELASDRSDKYSSPALISAAMRQVDEEVSRHNLAEAVPNPRHRRWALAVGIPLIIVIIGILIIPAPSRNALARWLTPWRKVERYTFAQLDGNTDNRVVAYAEPFNVNAQLKENSPWKPESGQAQYADQNPVAAEREESTYKFELPPQTKDGKLNLRIGDARRTIPIEPKLRPALKELVAKVQLPEYLQRTEPEIVDVRGGIINIVKDSSATLEATITRELTEATLNNRPQKVDGSRIITEPISDDTTTEIQLAWKDKYGLTASVPQIIQFEVNDDEAPTVTLSKLKNNQVVLSTEVLTFEIQADDDYGVKQVGLEWKGIESPIQNPEPDEGEKTVSAGSPTSESLIVPATFSIERENIRPQSFRLRAYAEDYFPDRIRTYSPQIVLHVLSPTDHFKWVIGQMQLWAGAAKDVHDRELQLHQKNLELREMTPQQLDMPAQRKELQNQAAAERTNAAKLDSLIGSGVELLQEATKNDEFDPDQLNSWAEMLNKLEEIAGKKMPSVADLLAQAAQAPGQQGNQNPSESSQQNPSQNTSAQNGQQSQGNNNSESQSNNAIADTKKYGPDDIFSEKDAEETEENDDPNKSGDVAGVDRSKPAAGESSGQAPPNNPAPSVADVESGFNKPEKPNNAPPGQMVGGLGLATTTLKGSGREEQDDNQDEQDPSASDFVIQAVEIQKELLDAFSELSDEIKKLLAGLENSTFVKRLKAASRKQIDVAVDLNKMDAFGLANRASNNQDKRKQIAYIEEAEAKTVNTIIQDMAAYVDRRPNEAYLRVLKEMEDATVANEMKAIITSINRNMIGVSTIEAEYWADTFDRWAEQLVGPMPPAGGEGGLMELPNLPPEIILRVLRVIDREMQLREETREVEQARNALTEDEYYLRSEPLSDTQYDLAEETLEIAEEILLLPDADTPFIQQQYQKVARAAEVMDETESILATPETGPKAIAAITEVIEILLETRRTPNTPPITNAPPATAAAIMLMGAGDGDDSGQAFIEKRAPQQTIGRAGRVLPEEYRQGLDVYFNILEGN